MTDELGFDLPADLRSPGPSSSPLPSLSPTTRGVTTRGISTTGAEFLRSLPLSVDETLARARASGRPLRFGQRELYVWKIRLAVERGLVRPPPGSDGRPHRRRLPDGQGVGRVRPPGWLQVVVEAWGADGV
jgi:hypothetical protein